MSMYKMKEQREYLYTCENPLTVEVEVKVLSTNWIINIAPGINFLFLFLWLLKSF